MRNNDRLTIGILAHVDAGKTTLSEAILYKCGAIRKMGRVDHGDAFMDTDVQEKERGITIFSGQAQFDLPLHRADRYAPAKAGNRAGGEESEACAHITLLDTPGHVDFSAEMERTLGVLDYAVLVISGKDGVQGHTVTLWNLLERYRVPVFFFVNKMDMEGTEHDRLFAGIRAAFGSECMDFSEEAMESEQWHDEAAMCDESIMDEYLGTGTVSGSSLAKAIKSRNMFPCFFGSALKQEGVDELLTGIADFAEGYSEENPEEYENQETLLRVFRITRDEHGERLTHVKILRGRLKVRDTVGGEKINQIRVYSGSRFMLVEQAGPGTICCLTGPAETGAGQITGDRVLDVHKYQSEAVMSYSLILPETVNVHETFMKIKQLEEEDPQLNVAWDEEHQEIKLNLMGQVQLEIIGNIIKNRLGIDAGFSRGHIAYKETITRPVTGAGHYEPLRHYAEVHLLMEPLPPGSGLVFRSPVSSDELDTNWQRLIMTHLKEREHRGTLTGSPITDMRISIVAGKAHDKHTEGGDFRQATYRAIRQGLRKALDAKAVKLLEPWYEYSLEVPREMVGRAMADIQRMGGTFGAPDSGLQNGASPGTGAAAGQPSVMLSGRAPVSEMKDYMMEVASYTKGYGHLSCRFSGYEPCHNQDEIVSETAYDPDSDVTNTADSVFCEHGAGRNVSWDKADEMMHVSYEIRSGDDGNSTDTLSESDQTGSGKAVPGSSGADFADDKELDRIFEKTFGTKTEKHRTIEARQFDSELERRKKEAENRRRANEEKKKNEDAALPEYLLVDGYNIIFAWEELKELAKVSIDGAREALIEILSNYQGFRKCRVIAVFDAYRVKGGQRHFTEQNGVTVVYTREAETADSYIERTTYELSGKDGGGRRYRVRVATSDRLEQMIIMGNNARRVSAMDFRDEIRQTDKEICNIIEQLTRKNRIDNPNRIIIPEKQNGGKR